VLLATNDVPIKLARNSAAAEKSESESEGGQKSPPNPLPFCPPDLSAEVLTQAERLDFRIRNLDFRQKKFGF